MQIAKSNAHLMQTAVLELFQKITRPATLPFDFLFQGNSFLFEVSTPNADRSQPTPGNEAELARAEQFIQLFVETASSFGIPISVYFPEVARQNLDELRNPEYLARMWKFWGAGGLHLLEIKIGLFKEEHPLSPGALWPPREEPVKYLGAEITQYYIPHVWEYLRTGVLPPQSHWNTFLRHRLPVELSEPDKMKVRSRLEEQRNGFGALERIY
jgi:hypothetical protein